MRKKISRILTGKSNQTGGLLALSVLMLFVMGCVCGKGFDLSNLSNTADNENRRAAVNNNDNADNDGVNNRNATANKTKNSNSSGSSDTDSAPPAGTEESSPEEAQVLTSNTMSDFADALESGDFSTMYSKSSEDFKATYTEEKMKQAFSDFVERKDLIVPVIRKTETGEANFDTMPYIRKEKGLRILVINGSYPTKPALKFKSEYVRRENQWKLLKFEVRL